MWKKLLRILTAFLPVDRRRSGACQACGACCQLVFRCPFLTHDAAGTPRCRIYRFRPPACRKYPRTAHEWVTQATCGFSFGETDAVVREVTADQSALTPCRTAVE